MDMKIKRYDIYAYCHRCGSAEGAGAVEVDIDEDEYGGWVKYSDVANLLKEQENPKLEERKMV